jgi:hypothetical protein
VKEERTSFLKKRSKKLLLIGYAAYFALDRVRQGAKVFWFFFSKKNSFLVFELNAAARLTQRASVTKH